MTDQESQPAVQPDESGAAVCSSSLEDAFPELIGATFRFWTCPACIAPTIDWAGDTATCQECGRTNQGRSYPTKLVKRPDPDKCRIEVLKWMKSKAVSYRRLSEMTGIAASNLNAMLRGTRPLGLASIERIYSMMD